MSGLWESQDVSELPENIQEGGFGAGGVVLRVDRERWRSFVGLDCNPCRHGDCDCMYYGVTRANFLSEIKSEGRRISTLQPGTETITRTSERNSTLGFLHSFC